MGRTKSDKEKEKDVSPKAAQEVDDSEEVSNKDLKTLFTKLIKKLETSMNANLESLGEKISNVSSKLSEVEKALDDQNLRITDLEQMKSEKIGPQEEKITELENQVEELQRYIDQQENRSRKYNLLFYGLPKVDKEDTTEVVLNCLESTLGVSEAKDIIIQNSHRIPKNPSNTYKPSAPEAIIVKFAKMADRNLILHRARVTTLPKGMAIRTDLVNHLKKKRSELASKAYKLRREKNLKTRIIETKDDVILQCRRKSEDKWIPYQG